MLMRERAGGNRRTEQHETELAGLRKGQREAQSAYCGPTTDAAETKGNHRLGDQQSGGRLGEQCGLCARQIQIGRHADRHEEEAQQQTLERFDVGLHFMTILRLRQEHPGHEGAERG